MHNQQSPFSPFMSFSTSQSQSSMPMPSFPSFLDPNQSSMSMTEENASQIAALQAKLNQRLGPEYISQRPGPGGGPKLTYAEGWKIINLANEIFGFNGWSSHIINMTVDYCDYNEETRRYNVGVSVLMRVTLKGGTYHEDVGYGLLENSKSKGAALDKCKKEAVTDALKRALRNFGNILGNCLYDKSYTSEVIKIKVPPVKFNGSDLHRRAEFQPDIKPNANHTPAPGPSAPEIKKNATSPVFPKREPVHSPPRPPPAQAGHRAPVAAQGTGQNTSKGSNKPIPATITERNVQRLHAAPTSKVSPIQRQTPPNKSSLAPQNSKKQPESQRCVSFHKTEHGNAFIDVVEEYNGGRDESFGFSDDDAFLANVDMGDGDLGRPINYEEGVDGEDENVLDEEILQLHPAPKHPSFVQQGQGQQNPGSSSSSSRQGQQQQHVSYQRQIPASSDSGRQAQQPQQQQRTTTMQPPTNNSFRRSGAAGGFNFPPGMDAEKLSKDETTTHSRQTDNARLVAGTKRTSTDVPTSRTMYGIGLAQQQSRPGVNTGGSGTDERDPKRFKR